MAVSAALVVPAVIRGAMIADDLTSYGGRGGEVSFLAPDAHTLLSRLTLRDPAGLEDLQTLPLTEIVDFLAALGPHLSLARNALLQDALRHSAGWSDLTEPLLRASYEQLPDLFTAESVREIAELTVGVAHLEGWVEHRLRDGRVANVRALGARAVHVVAGNSPLISAVSIIRNAITRSDAIIKSPSNDPLTALAIARTMCEVAPDHPVTRHLSVAYWRGGDESFEHQLYHPRHLEKIVAWGGFASVRHVARYVQPGLELVTLDPKRSATIIGPEAFADETTVRQVAVRAATDIGALNQLGCVNARVLFVIATPAQTNRLAELIYDALVRLPESVSTKPRRFDPELRAQLQALRSSPEFYSVYGGRDDEGAVIVSELGDPVDFHRTLSGRVANLVPVNAIADVLPHINAATQTIGIYPEAMKRDLRDRLGLQGAQRLVSLGYAADPSLALPQDAIEPVRRMVRWIVDETCDETSTAPLWSRA